MDTSATKYHLYTKDLDKLGFSTFQVFNNHEPEQLRKLYTNLFNEKDVAEGLSANHNSTPAEQALYVSNEIKNIVDQALQPVFEGYEYFIGHFMVKGAHTGKEFPLHQDWNIVHENKHKSYQIWIPLQLTYPANGGMFVVPGSHKFFNNYRSGSYGLPVVPYNSAVDKIVTDIIVPPGNVLVYQNGLFHGSYPNTTDDVRMAVIVNYVEKNAPTYYFHKNTEQQKTELYTITGDVLLNHLPQLEKGIVDSSIPLAGSEELDKVDNATITANDLITHYEKAFGSVNAQQIKQLHITIDESLENLLNKEGYTVIDLLDEPTVQLFKDEYNRLFGNIDRTPGRFTTLQSITPEQRRQIHQFIVENVDVHMRKYFKDYIIPVSQFYTKKAFTSGDIDIHADSTLLMNHQLEPHYAIWIPLIDVDETNGTLMVIPRTHKVRKAFFGGTVGGYHQEHMDWLRQYEVPIKLKAGQAIIFDNNLLHNSTANTSAFDRLCFTFRITHFASQYYSFYRKDRKANLFDASAEEHNYYMTDAWDGSDQPLTGKYIGTFKNSVSAITREELEKTIKA